MNFCSSFTPNNASPNYSNDINFGTCAGKRELESINHTGLGLGITLGITFYERIINKYHAFSILELDLAGLFPLGDGDLDNRFYNGEQIEYELLTSFINIDIVNYTYYF